MRTLRSKTCLHAKNACQMAFLNLLQTNRLNTLSSLSFCAVDTSHTPKLCHCSCSEWEWEWRGDQPNLRTTLYLHENRVTLPLPDSVATFAQVYGALMHSPPPPPCESWQCRRSPGFDSDPKVRRTSLRRRDRRELKRHLRNSIEPVSHGGVQSLLLRKYTRDLLQYHLNNVEREV